jgi:hypothetical protein
MSSKEINTATKNMTSIVKKVNKKDDTPSKYEDANVEIIQAQDSPSLSLKTPFNNNDNRPLYLGKANTLKDYHEKYYPKYVALYYN